MRRDKTLDKRIERLEERLLPVELVPSRPITDEEMIKLGEWVERKAHTLDPARSWAEARILELLEIAHQRRLAAEREDT